ncbi:MAG: NYN domain-containing protein [Steroidobacteraceae bacterium]
MSYPLRYAVLIDGGFAIQKLSERTKPKAFPSADDVEAIASAIAAHECVAGQTLLRIYFYHAKPATGVLANPLDGAQTDLSKTETFKQHESLLDTLELRSDFALRLGELSTHGWKLGGRAMKSLLDRQRPVQAADLVPSIEQKGVDLRIGLDIARLALTQSVQSIVVVTGDSDLIPAFKFARREGLRVFLCHFKHGIKRDLKAHADRVIEIELPAVKPVKVQRAAQARKPTSQS